MSCSRKHQARGDVRRRSAAAEWSRSQLPGEQAQQGAQAECPDCDRGAGSPTSGFRAQGRFRHKGQHEQQTSFDCQPAFFGPRLIVPCPLHGRLRAERRRPGVNRFTLICARNALLLNASAVSNGVVHEKVFSRLPCALRRITVPGCCRMAQSAQSASRARPQRRDHRARALCAQHSARHAELAARPGSRQAGIRLRGIARCDGLDREPDRSKPISISPRASSLPSNARMPSCQAALANAGRYRKILQRLDSRRAHHLQHAGGQEAAGDDRLVAGRAQPQGRHRGAWPTTGAQPIRSSTWWAPRSLRPTTSTTTAWARIRKDFSIIAAMRCAAGTTTGARRRPALRSVPGHQQGLRPASGTTPRRPPSSRASTSRPSWTSRGGRPRLLLRDRRQRRPTRSTPATGCSPAPRPCCPRPPTATSSASSATQARTKCWPWPRAIATAICPPMCWWSTGSTTRRWARWTSIPSTGPIPRR